MLPGIIVLLFLIFFHLYRINLDYYFLRDDAVISWSIGKNIALFGLFGVDDKHIVEASSSPLTVLVALITILVYENSSIVTIYIVQSTLAILLILNFAYSSLRQLEEKKSTYLNATIIIAVFTLYNSWTTFGWILSGMENLLYLSLSFNLIITLAKIIDNLRKNLQNSFRLILFLNLNLFLFTLARVENILFVGILFIYIFILTGLRNIKSVVRISFIALFLGVIFHLIRFFYFGSFIPNTGDVQNKSIDLVKISIIVIAFGILTFIFKRYARSTESLFISKIIIITIICQGFEIGKVVFGLLIILLILNIYIQYSPKIVIIKRIELNLTLIFLMFPMLQKIIFGNARLDYDRIFGMSLAYFSIATAILIYSISSANNFLNKRKQVLIIYVFILTVMSYYTYLSTDKVRDLCCKISPYDTEILKSNENYKARYGLTSKTIIASPDLGKITYKKNHYHVDLGWLGDPVLFNLWKFNYEHYPFFLNELIKPDVVEIHGEWACGYNLWLNSTEFRENYRVDISFKEKESVYKDECPYKGIFTVLNRDDQIEIQNENSISEYVSENNKLKTSDLSDWENCIYVGGIELKRCATIFRGLYKSDYDPFPANRTKQPDSKFTDFGNFVVNYYSNDRGWSEESVKFIVKLSENSAKK